MRHNKLILTAILTLLLSANINSAIEPIEELRFTIPGLNGAIEQFVFNDIDNDNFPEVLATDGSILVLYSIAKDSILFQETIPVRADTLERIINYKILFDDVNRDSIPDILYASYFTDSDFWGFTPNIAKCEAIFYDGANLNNSQSIIISLDSLLPEQIEVGSNGWNGVLYLKSINMNGNAYNELIIAIETVDAFFDYSNTYSYVRTDGSSILFHSFPDSVIKIKNILISNAYKLKHDDTVIITNTNYSFWGEGHGRTTTNTTDNNLLVFDTNLNQTLEFNSANSASVECSPIVATYDDNSSIYLCSGNIDTTNINRNILINYYWHEGLLCYAPPPMISVDTSGSELFLMNYIAPDSLEEIWTLDITEHNYTNFLYHPLEEGYFFAFEENSLIQFNGSDGSFYQRNDTLPLGTRSWVEPFTDGLPRLAITNDNNITLIKFDISTGINDIHTNNLPTNFTLAQNYPNPFNPSTRFSYSLPSKGNVKADIFNILGQKIITLIDQEQTAGEHFIDWDATEQSSGMYLFKVSYENQTKSIKTMLLK